MRLFIQVLFNLVYSFRYRAIAAPLLQSLKAGKESISDQALFFVDLPDIFLMCLASLLNLLLEFFWFFEEFIRRDQHATDHSQRTDQAAHRNNCPYAYIHGFYLHVIFFIKIRPVHGLSLIAI